MMFSLLIRKKARAIDQRFSYPNTTTRYGTGCLKYVQPKFLQNWFFESLADLIPWILIPIRTNI